MDLRMRIRLNLSWILQRRKVLDQGYQTIDET